MKILVTAIACNPFTGSEAALGWFALRSLSELGELWLLVGKDQEAYLDEYKGVLPANVHQGLALAKKQGVRFNYRVTSQGPEQKHLESLAAQLGFEQEVGIGKRFDSEEYVRELQDTDLYLLPSLREGGGTTMMEAMLAGAVPIVAECGGPDTAVTDECGIRIPIESPLQMAREIATTLIRFDGARELLARMGQAASRRIAENYNEQRFNEAIRSVYQKAIQKRKQET